MQKNTQKERKLVIIWSEKVSKEVPKVRFAGCGSNCYSGTCDSCKN